MENMNSIASLVMAVVVNEKEEDVSNSSSSERRKKLWGLVVCHHTSPRFVPFPLRYACEFLAQVFAIHVNKEIDLEKQIFEKSILKTQSLLCDMLSRDAPLGIVSQSPNVMDLVKCDGAVLIYKNKNYKLGITPSDYQMQDIVFWLEDHHRDSTGLSIESLYDAGYPGALELGEAICGMAVVKITDKDWLFWFRSHTASIIRWGGAKHEPDEKDDGTKMHPRSSFKAFLEVVKRRSLPWKKDEMDAIHSLQLVLRNAFEKAAEKDASTQAIRTGLNDLQIDGMRELEAVTSEMVRLIETASVPIFAVDVDGYINGWNLKISELTGLPLDKAIGKHFLELVEDSFSATVSRMLELALQGKEERNVQFEIKTYTQKGDSSPITLVVNACASRDVKENVVGVCFIAQDLTGQKIMMDKFTRIEGDYKNIVHNPNPLIPPIFGTDEFGWCTEWNTAMTRVSGLQRADVMNKMLLGEIFGTNGACCRLKNEEDYVNLGVVLNSALSGQASERVQLGFFSKAGKYVECLLCVSKNMDGQEAVKGVICFLHLASHELQQALHLQRLSEQKALKPQRALTYMRREVKSSLSGVMFWSKLLEGTELDDKQKNLLRLSGNCQHQLNKVLDDTDLDHIIEGYLVLDMVEFNLQDVVTASISQVMKKSREKGITVVNNVSRDLNRDVLLGDSLRLQQILAAFLLTSVSSASNGSQVSVSANLTRDSIGVSVHIARLKFRITHSSGGVPQQVLGEMFEEHGDVTEDGIGLFISRKLVKMMNGEVQYLREAEGSSFIINVELAFANKKQSHV